MRYLLLIVSFAAGLPLAAQTFIDLPQIRAASQDAVLVNLGGGSPRLIRATICQDRTGATCAPGAFYVDSANNLKSVPAPGQRHKCQPPVVPVASAQTATLQITEASFVADSIQLYMSGLLMSGQGGGTVQPDYARAGQTITLNRPVDQQTVLQLCYAY